MVEHPFAVGALVPPHVHTLEDEISIVLEGPDRLPFPATREVVLDAGRLHRQAPWRGPCDVERGPTPARMIEIITPAGFERFFASLTRLPPSAGRIPIQVAALADQYGLPFAEPDWLPDVIARYGLTPPRR